jgi:hypothetical protein
MTTASRHKQFHLTLAVALACIMVGGCEKIIDIDLNSTAPQIVIDAELTIENGCRVALSQTINFDEANVFPPVTDAMVTLKDNLGYSETLASNSSGGYKTNFLIVVPGRTYTLTVQAKGKTYTASAYLPVPVQIDSLVQSQENTFLNKQKYIKIYFRDPAGIKNYYRFVEFVRTRRKSKYFLFEDKLSDGEPVAGSLFSPADSLQPGDRVIIQLQSIDKGVYDYFRTIQQAIGGNGPQNASPSNPLSNFDNGALGFFNVYSYSEKQIFVH